MTKRITLLGSTGSIGSQTLACCKRLGYTVNVLAAHKNVELLEKQAREYHPRYLVVSDENAYLDLKTRLADTNITVRQGMESMCEAAAEPDTDIVCNAVVGMVGLQPTLAATKAGKTVALSNKETLVAGGKLVMESAAEHGATILPVDSEHSAIFQALQGNRQNGIEKILLTASGGPFRGKTAAELEKVTLHEALQHPNWAMGAKITVDSATLMNKALELIEAMWLFDVSPDEIEVLIHPQSVIHSAVEFIDGSILAQLGVPDMAIPIQYALTWPDRKATGVKRLSLTDYTALTFEKPDLDTFLCLRYGTEAAKRGGLYPCMVNSANEQAVELFLKGKIRFVEISRCIAYVTEHLRFASQSVFSLHEVLETDRIARELVLEYCGSRAD